MNIRWNDTERTLDVPDRAHWPAVGGHPDDVLAGSDLYAILIADESVIILHSKGIPALFVQCSDVFAWGCADCEPAPLAGFGQDEEVVKLYETIRATPGNWGGAAWCIDKRQMRPQKPVEKAMREAGAWRPEWDTLKRAGES